MVVYGRFEPVLSSTEAALESALGRSVLGLQFYASRGGSVLADAGLGWTSPARDELMRPDFALPLACAAKALDAVAIARLRDQGLCQFDTPLGEFWPELYDSDGAKLTISNLLTHTAFQRDPCLPRAMDHWDDRVAVAITELLATAPPSGKTRYSIVSGWQLLGAITSRLVTADYELAIARTVSAPLEIRDLCLSLAAPKSIRRQKFVRTSTSYVPAAKTEAAAFQSQIVPGLSPTGPVRSIARVYEAVLRSLAGGDFLTEATAKLLTYPARPKFWDDEFGGACTWANGFAKSDSNVLGTLASEQAFGALGRGGVGVMADPELELVVAVNANGSLSREEMASIFDGVRRDVGCR